MGRGFSSVFTCSTDKLPSGAQYIIPFLGNSMSILKLLCKLCFI